MAKYRDSLPQLKGGLFLTDGGIETTLIFHEGLDLPYFAAFDLLKDQSGQATLRRYYSSHASIARNSDCGFILESAAWRASAYWGARPRFRARDLAQANPQSTALPVHPRRQFHSTSAPTVTT